MDQAALDAATLKALGWTKEDIVKGGEAARQRYADTYYALQNQQSDSTLKTGGESVKIQPSDINPGSIPQKLTDVSTGLTRLINQISGGIQAQQTVPQVAAMTAQQQLQQQINQILGGVAGQVNAAQNAIQAQMVGNVAGLAPLIPQAQQQQPNPAGKGQDAQGNIPANRVPPQGQDWIFAGDLSKLVSVTYDDIAQASLEGRLQSAFLPLGELPNDSVTNSNQFCVAPYIPHRILNGITIACIKPDPDAMAQGGAGNDVIASGGTDDTSPEPTPSTSSSGSTKPGEDCIKVCITNLPDSKPATPTKYQLYKTETGVCYVLKGDVSPKSSKDTLLSSEPDDTWVSIIANGCGAKQSPTQPQSDNPSGSGSITVGGSGDCNADFGSFLLAPPGGIVDVLAALGFDLKKIVSDNAVGVTDIANPAQAAIKLAKTSIANGLISIGKLIDQYIFAQSCGSIRFGQETTYLVMGQFVNNFLNGALDPILQPTIYDRNLQCPYILPSAADALSAYLANQISADKLACLVQLNGQVLSEFSPSIEASRAKHTPLDLAAMRRRGIITESDYDGRIRELGYLHNTDADEIFQVTEQIPQAQDIVRFMVRDADNEDIVTRFNLDVDFEKNYAGQLKDWAKQNGVTDKYMQYLWRSHWEIPSPTQLYEMYRRLRHSTIYNPTGELETDIRAALVQQDIAPFWIDRVLALSFAPLTRTDAKRAYEIGAIDRSELLQSFYDGGYSDENAERLAKFADKQLQLKYYRHPMVSQYAAGYVAESELTDSLTFEGAKPEQIEAAKKRAITLATINSRKACTKSLKRQFFIGDIDQMDLTSKLTQLGVSDDVAGRITAGWVCERSARGKTIPAMRLAKLFREGIITDAKYVKNLIALGYTSDAALDLLAEQTGLIDADRAAKKAKDLAKVKKDAEQQAKDQAKANKQALQQAKQDQSDAAKFAREQAARDKLAQQQADKAAASAQKGLDTIAAKRTKLRNTLLDIATNISKKTGQYLGDILDEVQRYSNTAKAAGIDPQGYAECGLAASKVFNGEDTTEFFKQWGTCWTYPGILIPTQEATI
jgi:hypothetical protein